MAEEIRALSAQLAQDPGSLVFLRLGELLRRKGQIDSAHRVALTGLERHPHNSDAHDMYARILADKHDYERAFEEWDLALRIAPHHLGALKGLAFLYFKVGDITQAETHLVAAQRIAPDDPSIAQALTMVRGAGHAVPRASGASPEPVAADPAAALERDGQSAVASPAPDAAVTPLEPAPVFEELEEARVFAALEAGQEGLLLLDDAGRVVGGGLRTADGAIATDEVAAYLAGGSQEAARAAKLLGRGAWTG